MEKNDFMLEAREPFYKHEISKQPPCDAYSLHTHSMYELIYIVSGDATHIIEDRKYKLKKGDLILIRPLHYHFIQIDSPIDYERYDILFDAQMHHIESVSLVPEWVEVLNLSANPVAVDIFRKMDYYQQHLEKDAFYDVLSHLLSELFYNVSISPQKAEIASESLSPLLSEALRYINDHLFTLDSTLEIAKTLFISESYLFRLFKKELHQTPKRYVTNKRLLMAQTMILSGKKPVEVCEQCGFGDYTAFYRSYVSFFGHSPSQEQIHRRENL